MINNIHIHPKDLTPSMKKYQGRYSIKSTTNSKHVSPSLSEAIERHNVVEFDNGCIEFNLTENQLIIHTIYAENDYEYKFTYIYKLAKELGKKEIVFETTRNPKVWIRMIDRIAKKLNNKSETNVKGYTMCVTLD